MDQNVGKHRIKKTLWAGVVTSLGIFLGSLTLIPRVGVAETTPSLGNYPSNEQFKFTNNTIYALHYVRLAMGICEISGENAAYDENKECDYKSLGSLTYPGWSRDLLRTDDNITVSPGERLGGKLKGLNIGFQFLYQPWHLPIICEKIFAYKTKKGADGQVYWFAIPNPGSNGCSFFNFWP